MHKLKNNYLFVVVGSIILAFGLYYFNYRYEIGEGGVIGLLLLIKNVFHIPVPVVSIIIDFSLFIVGIKYFGKTFLLKATLATICFASSYACFEQFPNLVPTINHISVVIILAGLFVGVGVGLIVLAGGASGGDDVIALILNKKFNIKLWQTYLALDFIVIALSLSYLSVYHVLLSICAFMLSGRIIYIIHSKKA